MSTYWQKLRDPRWQKRRLEILQRDKFTCRLCADDASTLHVHHLRYERGADPWESLGFSLLTVCENCHEAMHQEQYGSSIVESLIAGGADINMLHAFSESLQSLFQSGPGQKITDYRPFEEAIDKMRAAFAAAIERSQE